jgi:diketogulonate reductase-like aldo/keto reductase
MEVNFVRIELHPYVIDTAEAVVDLCHKNGIKIQAYSPQAPVNAKPGWFPVMG